MPGLKRHFPDIRFSGNKVTPDEIDSYRQYCVIKPGVGTAVIGTVAPGTVAGTFVLDTTRLDYPRNLLFSIVGPAGGVGGTVSVTGKNQFGVTQSETITIASAAGGGTQAGSLIFAEVSLGTYDPNGGDNQGTPCLGVAIGTAGGTATGCKFGLPDKIGGTSDIKAITFIDNGAVAEHAAAGVANVFDHSFSPAQAVAAADDYIVLYKPTYDLDNEVAQTGL